MARVNRFTPLAQMPAVVLDTETTGLDVSVVRLVQISAVRFAAGQVMHDQTFDQVINPGVPIPPAATAVHHITDEMVATAPRFDEVLPALDSFLDGAVLVGQSIGFDLAVLLRETQRIGTRWQPPRFLDTKLLAAALDSEAREFGLDALAERFGVTIAERHSALADALATADIFARLLPALAAAGIRTLADAEAHSNAQTRIRSRQAAQGWYDVTSLHGVDAYESGRDAQPFTRVDTFAFRHRVEHVMARPPLIVPPAMPIAEAVRLMIDKDVDALLAGDAGAGRADGIVTQRDIMRALARDGAGVLTARLETIMSEPVATLPREAFLYRALARMQRLGVQHLAVEDSSRRAVGLLSLRDLVTGDNFKAALAIGDGVSTAQSPRQLAAARAELPVLAKHLRADGVEAHDLAAVVSVELHALLGRAAAQAEQRMESQGDGRPPVPYALLALGRIGRNECLLVPESEHALVFESGDADGFADRWFATFAAHLGDVLRGAALPAAPDEATDPRWRASLDGWRASINGWIAQPNPPLADVGRLADSVFVFGDDELATDLLGMARDLMAGAPALLSAMVPAPAPAPSLGPGRRINLASAGLEPIEAAARVLALAGRVEARATSERLGEAAQHTGLSQATADDLVERHERLLRCVLDQQLADVAAGVAPSYAIDPSRLGEAERASLAASLSHIAGIRPVVRMALAAV